MRQMKSFFDIFSSCLAAHNLTREARDVSGEKDSGSSVEKRLARVKVFIAFCLSEPFVSQLFFKFKSFRFSNPIEHFALLSFQKELFCYD